jgi:predicted transcriptional regulator
VKREPKKQPKGQQRRSPGKSMTTVELDDKDLSELRTMATVQQRSVGFLIRRAVRDFLAYERKAALAVQRAAIEGIALPHGSPSEQLDSLMRLNIKADPEDSAK